MNEIVQNEICVFFSTAVNVFAKSMTHVMFEQHIFAKFLAYIKLEK
jgi:hypothetical protein